MMSSKFYSVAKNVSVTASILSMGLACMTSFSDSANLATVFCFLAPCVSVCVLGVSGYRLFDRKQQEAEDYESEVRLRRYYRVVRMNRRSR